MPAITPRDPLWRRMMRSGLAMTRAALRHGLDFALPPSCLCCGRETPTEALPAGALCSECHAALCPPQGPECRVCAAPVGPYLDTAHGCIHCRHDTFHFDAVIRLGVYRDLLRRAVLQAKSVTGEAMARLLADRLVDERSADWTARQWDVIVPIPHHWTRRLTQRQAASESIAERLADRLRIPCDRGLVRKVHRTPRQAGSAPSVRRKQQRHAFAASADSKDLKILLVDDVLTTGATADEAAKAFQSRGAASVTVAVIARGLGEHG